MTAIQRSVFEWSQSRPGWQRDLLRRVASGPLTEKDRLSVRAMLLAGPGAPVPAPAELEDLPADAGELGDVWLTEVGDLRNVNAIDSGQRLQFGDGLNVVYGGNGTGKSGYTRLLRRLCRSAVAGRAVLHDVFRPETAGQPQTAVVVAGPKGNEQRFSVNVQDRPPRTLSAIGVFDARCADFYLSKPSTIDWLPASLRLLRALADAQDELAEMIREESRNVRTTAPEMPAVEAGTSASEALDGLDADTDVEVLARLGSLDYGERAELDELQRVVTVAGDTRSELQTLARRRAAAANEILSGFRGVAELLSDARIAALNEALRRRDEARAAEALLVQQLSQGALTGTGGPEWLQLWRAAERFVANHGHALPPAAGEPCPFCQQDADAATAERMARFHDFIRGQHRRAVAAAEVEIAEWMEGLPDAGILEARMRDRLNALPEGEARASTQDALATALRALASVADRVEGRDGLVAAPECDLPFVRAVARRSEAEADRLAALGDDEEKQRAGNRLRELAARSQLGAEMPAVRARIEALRRADALDEAARQLSTRSITNLLGKLSEVAIGEGLRSALAEELDGLDPVAGRVRVRPRSSKGEYTVKLELSAGRAGLGEVLSDGEQRGLALAFFLAESAIRGDASALIFDDPVSSLDHDRRRWVADRLVREAARRQVIVFTHDLAFLVFLNEAARNAGSEDKLTGQRLERLGRRVGIVSDDLPLSALSPTKRRAALARSLVSMAPLEREEPERYRGEVQHWLLELRRGYEGVIEHYLLRGVVRRMDLKIQQSHLPKVAPDPELVKRVLQGLRHASQEAHLDPPELQRAALTPRELQALLDEYGAVCDAANPTREASEPMIQPQLQVLPPEEGAGAA